MNNNQPIFRKSMSGYNKEDVNNYILQMSRSFSAVEENYKSAINDLTLRSNSDAATITSLREAVAELEALRAEADSLRGAADALGAAQMKISELNGKLSEYENAENGGKAQMYDEVCHKAGEILVIANATADDIVRRANDEAARILGEANNKKDSILKNISETADTVASDIGTYIRSAVDGCIDKITDSISEAGNVGKQTSPSKTVFLNDN